MRTAGFILVYWYNLIVVAQSGTSKPSTVVHVAPARQQQQQQQQQYQPSASGAAATVTKPSGSDEWSDEEKEDDAWGHQIDEDSIELEHRLVGWLVC